MKIPVLCVSLFLFLEMEAWGQLVRKRDYDAAFALQAGGETALSLPFDRAKMRLTPIAGLKMTFPFTRKWFLGAEVNYSEFRFGDRGKVFCDDLVGEKAVFANKQLQVPLYLKYMLNCNKASVLFGIYGSYLFDSDLKGHFPSDGAGSGLSVVDLSHRQKKWNGGIVAGYEHQIVKHLNLLLKAEFGAWRMVEAGVFEKEKRPFQVGLTLSYDILRIGDCGCD